MVGVFQLFGISFLIWTSVSLLRFIIEQFIPTMKRALHVPKRGALLALPPAPPPERIRADDVAVVIAAHNEEVTIGSTLTSLFPMTTPEHIYVGSDGSKDATVDVVRHHGCNILDIQPNGGKAKALTRVLEHYHLLSRYKVVLFLDADVKPDHNFFRFALPQFDDPAIVAVIGHAVSVWPRHLVPRWKYLFTAYRIRLWRILQFCIRYGQTWKSTNVTPIIPGGGSFYRTSALSRIRIDVPGLIIEDFNMTFELHHKRLGKIGFDFRAFVMNQEPYSLREYIKQITRWYVGFFQTLRHHGIWPSFFILSTVFFTLELFVGTLIFLSIPLFAATLLYMQVPNVAVSAGFLNFEITLMWIAVSVFVIDLMVSVIVALIERKPLIVLYSPAFIILRYAESVVFLAALIRGLLFRARADGTWKSPQRMSYGELMR